MRRYKARIATVAAGAVVCAFALVGCSSSKQTADPGSGQLVAVSASPSTPDPNLLPSSDPEPSDDATAPASPPPPPPPPKPLTCPHTDGKPQSAKRVLSELTAASKINEYVAAKMDPLGLDTALEGKLPNVHIPLRMLKAVAAQESAWTSTCISTDQLGYGTMQMGVEATSDTNSHFHTNFDRMSQTQNIMLGTAWLEYLTVHFGIIYFHSDFNLTTNYALRDAVLAAYNVGLNYVDYGGQIQIGPKGRQYATTVDALMDPSQACQKTWGR